MSKDLHVVADPVAAATMLNPLRLRILELLSEPASATSISPKLNLPRQHVNYHLRELEKVGLVEFVEERKRGNCAERLFRTAARAFVVAPSVLGALKADPGSLPDKYSSDYLVAIGTKLIGDLAGKRGMPTLALEASVSFESDDARGEFTQELAQTVLQLAAKYDRGRAEKFRVIIAAHPEQAT